MVELEISLDETREQYNQVLKANNNRAQQKKMAFLERNLEQLTNVQRGVSPIIPFPNYPRLNISFYTSVMPQCQFFSLSAFWPCLLCSLIGC